MAANMKLKNLTLKNQEQNHEDFQELHAFLSAMFPQSPVVSKYPHSLALSFYIYPVSCRVTMGS
jgi:hypothetical protein